MTQTTIPTIGTEANELYTALAGDLDINLDLPALTLPTDFAMPAPDPNAPVISPVTLDQLTSKEVDGTGVFDGIMKALTAHLSAQYEKGRITGADYANVYLGSVQGAMQFGVQFLLSKDRTTLENEQLKAQIGLVQAQQVRAMADIELARGQIQQMALGLAKARFDAYASRNDYALSKMKLVEGYNQTLVAEAQAKLTDEQVDTQRAQTKDTMADGTPVVGILGQQKALLEAQGLTAKEQLDSARAQTKDTLVDGSPVSGVLAVDKAYKEAQQIQMEHQGALTLEQVETQRAQTRDTLSTGEAVAGLLAIDKMIKQAQQKLAAEQADTQRAQTKDTLSDGTSVSGILSQEKAVKAAQSKLVSEQYESQRAQTRGVLSDNSVVGGMLGAQTALYQQQITSYKRDGESKALKLVLDTWTARKTIDDGVAVPTGIDTPAIDTMMSAYKSNLDL